MIELTPAERHVADELDAIHGGGGSYFDRDNDRITMGEWSVLFGRGESYRRIRVDELGKWMVSTVWLGLDHGELNGHRQIFETMVFHEEADDGEGHLTQRYATEAEARDGHADIVSKLARSTTNEEKDELTDRERTVNGAPPT